MTFESNADSGITLGCFRQLKDAKLNAETGSDSTTKGSLNVDRQEGSGGCKTDLLGSL